MISSNQTMFEITTAPRIKHLSVVDIATCMIQESYKHFKVFVNIKKKLWKF